jgi:hypothetical protein
MKMNTTKIAFAAMAALIAAGSLSACKYGIDGKSEGKSAAQKERNKCKGHN